jgi:predicted alpha/beta-fold hydrolase
MPFIESDFRSPWWLVGGHLQMLVPSTVRFLALRGHRVDITLPDEDRVTVDWNLSLQQQRPIVILTHALEGNAHQPYILGMAKAAIAAGYDTAAWNLRGFLPTG